MNELQYRANFFVQLLQSRSRSATALVVLALVYSHTTELNGWSESELLVVIGIQILLGGVIRTTIQPNMQRLMEEVRDGKLDFALTKPEDSQVLVSVRDVRIWRVVDVIVGRARARVRDRRARGRRRRRRRARSSLALLALGAVHDLLLLARDRDARVLDRARVVHHRALRRRLPDGPLADLDLSRAGCAIGVTFLVPIAFAITVPAEAVTSRLAWATVVLALVFAAVLFAFTRWFWRFGLRRYSGASA